MATALAATSNERDTTAPASRTRERVDVHCQRAILGLVLLILIYAPLATGAVRAFDFLVVQGLTILALGLWVVRLWAQPRFRLFWPPVCWAVLAFVLYAIVRCQLVDIEYAGRQTLIKVLVYAAMFFLVINNLNRRESSTVVTVTLIGLALGLAIFAIFQFVTHYAVVWQFLRPKSYLSRGSGTYMNPNHLAGFLEMVLPLSLAYALMSRFKATGKVVLGYCSLMIMAGIGVSLSRGGIIAAALILLVFFTIMVFNRDFWLRAVLLLLLVAVTAIVLGNKLEPARKRFAQIFAQGKVEDGRFQYWDSAMQMFRQDIWWGTGPGHYEYKFWAYRTPDLQAHPQYVHNDYLNTLCEWGIVGLALIAIVGIVLSAGVVKTWLSVRAAPSDLGVYRSNKGAFILGASLGLLAMVLHSVVDFNMQIPANALVAVALMALVSAHWRFATERFWVNPGRIGKVALTLTVLMTAGYLSAQGFHRGKETFWLRKAKAPHANASEVLAELMSAYESEPNNYETAFALGEYYRVSSLAGDPGYQKLAQDALPWYWRSMELNPHNPIAPESYGQCLDWIGQPKAATPFFALAQRLDPNGWDMEVCLGRHEMELRDYVEAKRHFERAVKLKYNELTLGYLDIVNQRLARVADPLKI